MKNTFVTFEQLAEGFKILISKGVKHFGLHAFLASNTVTNEYYPKLAAMLFKTAVELKKETGAHIVFINLSGGIGIPYQPEQQPADIYMVGQEVKKAFEEVLVPSGMGDVAIYTAYHHITVMGKEEMPCYHMYDITGGLCENNDKFAIDRMLPKIDIGDLIVIHDTGAHGHAMGYNYNGKLRSAEILLKEDGSAEFIRRAETPADYFATLDFSGAGRSAPLHCSPMRPGSINMRLCK